MRREIQIRAREVGAPSASRHFECAAAAVEPAQVFREEQPPSGERNVARPDQGAPIQQFKIAAAVRIAADIERTAQNLRQMCGGDDRQSLIVAPHIQIDILQLEPRQSGIPILHGDHGVADRELSGRQIIQSERFER